MPRCAALLLDLQVDFLSGDFGRMPVSQADEQNVVDSANAVLDGKMLAGCLPILVINQFPASNRIANFFRKNAAIEGSPGSNLDPRIHYDRTVPLFVKHRPSAFSNPALNLYLKSSGITHLYVMGVFAEGCVRATAVEARYRGYSVTVALDAIGTNAQYKRDFAQWAMKRAGVRVLATLPASGPPTLPGAGWYRESGTVDPQV